jgi:alpha-L-fucosidase
MGEHREFYETGPDPRFIGHLIKLSSNMKRFLLVFCVVGFHYAAAQSSKMPGYRQKLQSRLQQVDQTIQKGPFAASWDSLNHYRIPTWYLDAKFGIFIHWGVYSVPAFGSEWYPRQMYLPGNAVFKHHVDVYGPQSKFGYKDFIPQFTASKFDAAKWAKLFHDAGAKFVVPVGEHHDGFPMYDSDLTEYSAAKMGPHRDVVGQLEKAVRSQGMNFGVSSHRAEHWFFFNGGGKFDSDVKDPKYSDFYGPAQSDGLPHQDPDKDRAELTDKPTNAYLDDWLARSAEIVDKYNPDLVWFDWWIERPAFKPYLQRFAAFYYDHNAARQQGAAINYKFKAFPEKAAVLDIERGQEGDIRPIYWQTDTSISNKSWGYIENDTFKTPEFILGMLVDIVSKNGALLLNIGPDKDGVIPQQAQDILLAMGKWLAASGDAVYGTRPWKIYGEGPTKTAAGSFKDTDTKPYTPADIRFTTKNATLYAIALATPADGVVHVKSLAKGAKDAPAAITNVLRLGSSQKVTWQQSAGELTIHSAPGPASQYPLAFQIKFKSLGRAGPQTRV